MTEFQPYFEAVVGHEGGFTKNAKDSGNWTGGVIGKGTLKGTKYGIAAASYPDEDIEGLTLDRARFLYFRDYWQRVGCDSLPPVLRYAVFDSAVNNGAGNAARFLQRALGVADDGKIGPLTRAAIAKHPDPLALGAKFQTERATLHTKLSSWGDFGKGWCIRLAQIGFQSVRLGEQGQS